MKSQNEPDLSSFVADEEEKKKNSEKKGLEKVWGVCYAV